MSGTPTLSVVIPMMNEEEGIPVLFNRLIPILENTEQPFEVVCVNDGSSDGTLALLKEYQRRHPFIVIVDLSRNFGKEAALTAGLMQAEGQAVIPLDADLQDPPELIGEMLGHWDNGAEVVLAVRAKRETDTALKRATANAFYRIINSISEINIPPNAGDFRLMDRAVIEALKELPERSRFNKGIFAWLGFKTETIEYERPTREVGTTKWNYRKLWNFALDGITSFSSAPLRIWSYIGVLIAGCAMLFGLVVIFKVLILGYRDVPGYASLMTVLLFSNGIVLIGLGVIGEYLSRVFIETKGRPLVIIRKVHKFGQND
ncbi:glycosyltransferase family 2 protein [Brucella anthropi]|uniref:Glycosyltransferase family 2 protein n=1 Tax=Brucella anthropi TaxID=529 RepID=A0A6L3YZI9_BRUAN|nr:glycosyltransferase family 2 protein [Brucella anthropi]KAB2724301.1 glycosyltransferase family 2 protein [Brucella anthropi]KAB2757549.1 glycosyltransferase family 2 protein [Brucella anthropi]